MKKCVDYIGYHLGIQTLDDWYRVTNSEFVQWGGASLLLHFKHSLQSVLQFLYPEVQWASWEFDEKGVTHFYWNYRENRRKYLNWMTRKLGLLTYESVYRIHGSQLTPKLMHNYGQSVHALFSDTYQGKKVLCMSTEDLIEFVWYPWIFQNGSTKFIWSGKDNSNQKNYLNWLADELHICTADDWYKISNDTILQVSCIFTLCC